MNVARTFPFALPLIWLVACGGSEEVEQSQTEIVYEGNCDKAACADLDRPDTDCTETAPIFKCTDVRGTCAITYECPAKDDPLAAVSMAPCADEECGPPRTAAEAGCGENQRHSPGICGRLNNAKECKWHDSCVTLGPPLDESMLGPECGAGADAGPCPADKPQCVSLPPSPNVDGPRCVADPCAVIGCPASRCSIMESWPLQVACERN